MYNGLITCRALTHAQKLSRLAAGIGCMNEIGRTPQEIAVNGCGYAVRLDARCLARVFALMKENGIPQGRAFRYNGTGYEAVIV